LNFKLNYTIWFRIRNYILNADPDPGTPKMRIQCRSGSETLVYSFGYRPKNEAFLNEPFKWNNFVNKVSKNKISSDYLCAEIHGIRVSPFNTLPQLHDLDAKIVLKIRQCLLWRINDETERRQKGRRWDDGTSWNDVSPYEFSEALMPQINRPGTHNVPGMIHPCHYMHYIIHICDQNDRNVSTQGRCVSGTIHCMENLFRDTSFRDVPSPHQEEDRREKGRVMDSHKVKLL